MKPKTIQNNLFFEEVANRIAEGERVRIRAKGNSMLPFIRDRIDEVVLEKANEESFKKGSLLLVQLNDNRFVLHRVKKINETLLVLQGDGNLSFVEACTPNDVIAEASAVIRNGKTITKGNFRWNMYRYLWPENYLFRRIALGIYRRIF